MRRNSWYIVFYTTRFGSHGRSKLRFDPLHPFDTEQYIRELNELDEDDTVVIQNYIKIGA